MCFTGGTWLLDWPLCGLVTPKQVVMDIYKVFPELFVAFFLLEEIDLVNFLANISLAWEYQKGKYHCTIDLRFDCFGLVCFANKNKNCQLLS
jgi:hypothetical protein